MLTFLHISDIHLYKQGQYRNPQEYDMRHELKLDAERLCENENLKINGIIVCGDIAFSGKEDQYNVAAEFIEQLAGSLDVKPNNIFCVPGNHDVDHSIVKDSATLYAVQHQLEKCEVEEVDRYIDHLRYDPLITENDFLYAPISAYNEFAKKYASEFTMNYPNWCKKMKLNDTSPYILAVYGMNSTLISNQDDHKKESVRLMQIGRRQLPQREKNIIYMTVCHHPPDFWKDKDMERYMHQRAVIQLYGHKHEQSIIKYDHSVAIIAGALQPDKKKSLWLPRYNFLSIDTIGEELQMKIYPRIWNNEKLIFQKSIEDCDIEQCYKEIKLFLDKQGDDVPKKDEPKEEKQKEYGPQVHELSDEERIFVHQFMRLGKVRRKKFLLNYEVFEDLIIQYDDTIDEHLSQILNLAIENKLLDKMNMELKRIC